ncbi:MAG: hypothetical protein J0L78_10985 [Planctomycetes bacterium]|nr:hypothetical protein [Planctomycetota bacterium]
MPAMAWKAMRIALVAAMASIAHAQNCAPVQLAASGGMANDGFGTASAAGSDTIVFGSPGRRVGLNNFQGQASVFRFVGAAWSPEATLTASDGAANDSLGSSAAISGDTIVLGAPGKTIGPNTLQGAAYVFTRSGSVWTQQAKLVAADGAIGDSFGCSVAAFGDTIVVGAYAKASGANFNQGAVYIFTRSGSVWTQQAKLLASDGTANDFFGIGVGAGLDTVAIGASSKGVAGNLAQGAAYIFTRSGVTWSQQAKLVASDGAAGDAFGSSVSLSGNSVLLGAEHKAIDSIEYRGAGYVFTRSGSVWTQQARLSASDGAAFDYLGSSCVLSGDTAILGAPNQTVGGLAAQGSAYVFVRSGNVWSQQSKLQENSGLAGDMFGSSVALAGSVSVAAAPDRTVGANAAQGAAFVFGSNIPINIIQQPATLTTCTANDSLLSLTAAGTGPFGYQWQWKAGTAVPAWIPVAEGLNSGGSRTFTVLNSSGPSLTVRFYQQLDPGLSFAEFRCIVSNSCGSATSLTAQVKVCWADLNCDNQVDDADFVLFASAYNLLECSDPSMPPRCPSDLNFNSLVDDADFGMFASAYDALSCP